MNEFELLKAEISAIRFLAKAEKMPQFKSRMSGLSRSQAYYLAHKLALRDRPRKPLAFKSLAGPKPEPLFKVFRPWP